MKWAVAQIRKLKKPYSFEYEFDLLNSLSNPGDILDVKKCMVYGVMSEPSNDCFQFAITVDCELIMQCAISLEEVLVPLKFDTTVRFSYTDDDSSDDYLIDKDMVDLDKAILSEIVLNIPFRVVKEGYENKFDQKEEETRINPSFQALKKMYGGDDK